MANHAPMNNAQRLGCYAFVGHSGLVIWHSAPYTFAVFTGLVEKTVHVIGVMDTPAHLPFRMRHLTIAADWPGVRPGESIAVNGACLTVTNNGRERLEFRVIGETLDKTNLGLLKAGDDVHVERALQIGARFDGHFVQGHVDGTGRLVGQVANGDERRLTIEAPPEVAKYLVPKGSICVDGVSLTIAALDGNRFDVALIPTTLRVTTLGNRNVGYAFNLEADVISKSVVTFLERR